MHKARVCSALMLGLVALGCNKTGGKYETYKVTGKVLMNGSPVPGASVAYSPTATGKPAALGQTDTQGVYILTTYDAGDGAVEGEYKVMVTKSAPSASAETSAPVHDPTGKGKSYTPTHGGGGKGKPAGSTHLLPEKFAKAATTPITCKVEPKDNTIDIDLDQAK